jgi:hypothetical protein
MEQDGSEITREVLQQRAAPKAGTSPLLPQPFAKFHGMGRKREHKGGSMITSSTKSRYFSTSPSTSCQSPWDGMEARARGRFYDDEQHRKQVLLHFSLNALPKSMERDRSESTREVLRRRAAPKAGTSPLLPQRLAKVHESGGKREHEGAAHHGAQTRTS